MNEQGKMLEWHAIREVAAIACADPRTVQKFLRGQYVRGACGERIKIAIRKRERRLAKAGVE